MKYKEYDTAKDRAGKNGDFILISFGGTKNNDIAIIMKTMVWIIWIAGFIIGIVVGYKWGNMVSSFKYYDGKNHFDFVMTLVVWLIAFSIGLFPYGFAEIISLLQQGNTLSYRANIKNEDSGAVNQTADNNAKLDNIKEYAIDNVGQQLPFKLVSLRAHEESITHAGLELEIHWNRSAAIQGILADVTVNTLFGDKYEYKDVSFVNFRNNEGYRFVSGKSQCELSDNIFKSASSISVSVKKYVIQDKVYLPGDIDSEADTASFELDEDGLLEELKKMKSTTEVAEYVTRLYKAGEPIATKEMVDLIDRRAANEKFYGNNYKETIKDIMKYFGRELPRAEEATPVLEDDNNNISQDKAVKEEQIFCIKCGNKIDFSDAVFCPGCGEKIIR